ncbi:MAG: antibiotic biosynthesis monooxygenase [Chitinophagales bacterium]|nr:antibiotic biosynthesis monooxygenase [Bacteroidota bacterium]MCB9042633.1 antibiotic biosynthesis monooxygenase [Chitinophagales bacterium]
MIFRIVKLEFREDSVQDFLTYIRPFQEAIRASAGCTFLQIIQDNNNPQLIFTYSQWQSEQDLENYRQSALFTQVWAQTKRWFSAKPAAWTCISAFE